MRAIDFIAEVRNHSRLACSPLDTRLVVLSLSLMDNVLVYEDVGKAYAPSMEFVPSHRSLLLQRILAGSSAWPIEVCTLLEVSDPTASSIEHQNALAQAILAWISPSTPGNDLP